MVKHDKIELEIQFLGKLEEYEYGIDQFKNAYKRLIDCVAWECISEYRRKQETKSGDSKDITILAEINLFCFGVDSQGEYWKKFKNFE